MLSIKRIEAATGAFLQLQYAVGNPTDHVLTARLAVTQEQLPEITTEELQRTDRIYVLVGKFKEDAGVLNLLGAKPIFPQIVSVDIEYRNDENKVADFMAQSNIESFFKLMFDDFVLLKHAERHQELMDIDNLQILMDPINKVVTGAYDKMAEPSELVTISVLKQLGCTTDNIPVPYLFNYGSDFDPNKPVMCFEFGNQEFYVNVTPTPYIEAITNLPGVFQNRWLLEKEINVRQFAISFTVGAFGRREFYPLKQELDLEVPGLGTYRALWTTGKGSYLGYVLTRQS